MLIIYI